MHVWKSVDGPIGVTKIKIFFFGGGAKSIFVLIRRPLDLRATRRPLGGI